MVTLYTPFTAVFAAATGSGKTFFLKKFIEEQNELFFTPFKKVKWYYGIYQPLFEEMRGVEFYEGLPDENATSEPGTLLILDDLLPLMQSQKSLMEIFCVKSHHCQVSF